jgi:preprotein translocase subunit SecG
MMTVELMPAWAVATWTTWALNFVLFLTSVWLVALVLIQRGKGGGLAGAFGGAGGSSAFGSRAGDTFTKITIYSAGIWILLIMFMIKMTQDTSPLGNQATGVETRQPEEDQ